MKIFVRKGKIAETASEAAVGVCFEGETVLSGAAAKLDHTSGGIISEVIKGDDFTARLSEVCVIYSKNGRGIKRIVLAGLGKRSELSMEGVRETFAKVAQRIRSLHVTSFTASLDFGTVDVSRVELTEAVVEGIKLGLYQFTPFKTLEKESHFQIEELILFEEDDKELKLIRSAVKVADIISDATIFARDIVSSPANEMTPTDLANEAKEVAKGKNIKFQVMEDQEMRELGMNAILAVSSGSEEPPKFIVLEYQGGKKSSPFIVLVGKGITFDSGGISIKPSDRMEEMKSDMAGGAAVIATLRATAELGLPVNLVGLVPATENLPGGRALKPGDIIKTLSGQTVEVVSTDAEGRLILADALTYAARYKPAAVIDVATLTGACVVALGNHVIGMMGTDSDLMDDLRQAAQKTGERVWELPLWDEYHELIKGRTADFKNSGGRAGGAIIAAAFLSKFVGDYPWVHLDIAGPAWLRKERPYIPMGASGVGVRLLVQFLRNWYQNERGCPR